jgi:hypothetical protein
MLGLVTACGDGNGSSTNPPAATTTVVQINMGDAPADWVLSFSTTITSLTLHGSDGSLNVITSPTPIEFMQRMGTMEPVALMLANQANYTSASITLGDCNVTYIDPNTKTLMQKTITGPFTTDVPFGSGVKLAGTPLSFNFDLNLNQSLSYNNNFAFSPNFHFSWGAQGSGNGNNPAYGGMQRMLGAVSSVGNGYLVMTSTEAMNTFTVRTNTQTQFRGMAQSLSQLTPGMGILVTANLQADGTLLASRIQARSPSGGFLAKGIVTEVTGKPAKVLTVVWWNGAGMDTANVTVPNEKISDVDIESDSTFTVDDDRVDLSQLPFTPIFDASNVFPGQSVMFEYVPDNTLGVKLSTVYLEEQGFRGTTDSNLTSGTATTFTLTLPSDCAFTALTGATTITVYQQTGTNLQYESDISAGATVRVHGLLFQNGGQWVLVASTIASI